MERWLCVHERVGVGQPTIEALLPHLRELLQAGTGTEPSRPAGDGSFVLRVPTSAWGVELAKHVRCEIGTARRSGTRLSLELRWEARPGGHLFPRFTGALELEPFDDHRTQVSLVGTSTPPLGPVGAAVDAALLHVVAERTAQRLLAALRREIESTTREPATAPVAPTDAAMRVADAMTGHPVVVDEGTSLRTAALLLHHGGIAGLPVLDGEGILVGVVTEADLLPHVAAARWALGRGAAKERERRNARTVGEACSRPALCTAPDARLADAARVMLDRDASRLVVVEAGQVVGILTRHDVLRALIRSDDSLRHAIDVALQGAGHPNVVVEVEAARARLSGYVGRRSDTEALVGLLQDVDGLEDVDVAGLDWQFDDTVDLGPMAIT